MLHVQMGLIPDVNTDNQHAHIFYDATNDLT